MNNVILIMSRKITQKIHNGDCGIKKYSYLRFQTKEIIENSECFLTQTLQSFRKQTQTWIGIL